MKEEWRDVIGYAGLYQISNYGRVKSLDRFIDQKHYSGCNSHHIYKGKILIGSISGNYKVIDLHKNNKIERYLVHRLVAKNFISNPNNFKYINHKDNNPLNNRIDNIEWCTQSYNIQYAYNNGNKVPPHQKKVKQYDLNGNFIKEYVSINDAMRKTGIKNVSACCRNKRNHAGGYVWKYTE